MREAQTVSQKLHKDRETIIQFCTKYENIYLYGMGFSSQFIMNYLEEEEVDIQGIIVSEGHKKIDRFFNHDVYLLSELNIDKDSDGIIIGVGKKYQCEILMNLRDAGYVKNIYIQNIYCVAENEEIPHKEYSLEEVNNTRERGYFNIYNELELIGEEYKTDKSAYVHNYLNKYEFFLQSFKNKTFNLLELGVFKGASLKMWGTYFSKANIIGVDIDGNCRKYEGDNRKVIISDLSKERNIIALKKIKPMIIIDDASHFWSHQIKALFLLFESLPSGGIYILEDLETSFAGYDDYQDAVLSAYDVCAALAEVLTSQLPLRKNNIFANEIENMGKKIEMISMVKGSCVIIKK